MFKILFTLYWGHVKRYRWQFILILVGLILGLTTGILSFLYIRYDLTYDHHYPDFEDIYRLYREEIEESGKSVIFSAVPISLRNHLEDQFPEIELLTRINPYNKIDLEIDYPETTEPFQERISSIIAADTNFLKVFPQSFIQGSAESSLENPNSLIVTERFAEKYFGFDSPMGEIVRLNRSDYTITGVIENLPGNTHIGFEAVSSSLLTGMPAGYIFMKLNKEAEPDQLRDKLSAFFQSHPSARSLTSASRVEPVLIPLKDIHWAHYTIDSNRTEHKYYIWAISIIGVFVILICLFNFATVLSSQGSLRGKELGIKRVMGENKSGLFKSLFFETSITVGIGLIFSLFMIEMILPVFNSIADKNITEGQLYSATGILFIVGVWVLLSLASGVLPAIQYSRITVSETVKGMNEKPAKVSVSQILILMFQFIISFTVILVTVFIAGQVRMTRVMDLGFDKNNVIMLNNPDIGFEKQYEAMRTELLKYPEVEGVTVALNFPKRGAVNEDILIDTPDGQEGMFTGKMWVGKDYLKVMGFTLLRGDTFSDDFPDGVLVNETFANEFGHENIFGTQVYNNKGEYFGKIIGIVKDFNLYSLHRKIGPVILIGQGGYESGRIHIRISGRNTKRLLSRIDQLWQHFYPGDPFTYYFLDEDLASYYREDRIHSGFLWGSSLIAFVLGILGLFAMTAFDIQQKRKALAIHRVFGASYYDLLKHLGKLKIILLLIAFVLGMIISVMIYKLWVQNFAYRASISPAAIILVFVLMNAAYILTVIRLVRALYKKPPMDSLRIE